MNNSGSEKGNESSDALKFRAECNGQDRERREELDVEEAPRRETVQNNGSGADMGLNERVSLNSPDGDFEVTPELLMYEMDDEDIADDEETEDQEVALLEAEKDLPIEELLKQYGQTSSRGNVEINRSDDDDDGDGQVGNNLRLKRKRSPPTTTGESGVNLGTVQHSAATTPHNQAVSGSHGHAGRYASVTSSKGVTASNRFSLMLKGRGKTEKLKERDVLQEVDREKKTARVGEQYQVNPLPDKAPVKHWEDIYPEDFKCGDTLLWNPRMIPEEQVMDFLTRVDASRSICAPTRRHQVVKRRNVRFPDDELALGILKSKKYHVKLALSQLKSQAEPIASPRTWSEEEVGQFEGIIYETDPKKDFFKVKAKIPSRTVKQCIEFYYAWRQSPRFSDYRINLRPGNPASSHPERSMDDAETNWAENSGNDEFITHRGALHQHIDKLREEGKSVEENPDAGDENTPPSQSQSVAPPTLNTQFN